MAGKVKHITEDEFTTNVEQGKGYYLVDFWAPWCGPCIMIAPVLEELAAELEGKVNIVKLNVDDYGSVAAKYGISAIPTMILFHDGKPKDQIIGAQPKNRIKQFLLNNIS